jgi:hypothetical protein
LPAYEVRTKKVDGAPYTTHSIVIGGKVIRSQLGPFGAGEADDIVRAHMHPPASRLDDMKDFWRTGKPGPKAGAKKQPEVEE